MLSYKHFTVRIKSTLHQVKETASALSVLKAFVKRQVVLFMQWTLSENSIHYELE